MRTNHRQHPLLALVAGLILACGSTAALATPMLVTDVGGNVVGVNGLEEGGMTFNAIWTEGSFNAVGQDPPVFAGNAAGATSIVNQMINLFNANAVTPTIVGGLCTSNTQDCDLVVTHNVNAGSIDAFNVEWNQGAAQQWELMAQNWSRNFDNNLVAQVILTKVVPEPTSVLLLGLGLMGIVLKRRLG